MADPANLGPDWRRNCYTTAVRNGGTSRYSTFAFLAGALQDGCVASLNALCNQTTRIDIIRGRDVRPNNAKSWFWQRRKHTKKDQPPKRRPTFRDYVQENGLDGREISVGGRISIAHEDAVGYRDALISFLED